MDLKPNQATLQMHWRGCTKKWHRKSSYETKKINNSIFYLLEGRKDQLVEMEILQKVPVQLLHIFLAEQQHYNRVFAVLT